MDRKYIYRFTSENDHNDFLQNNYTTPHLSSLENSSGEALNVYYNSKPGENGYAWCYYNVTTTESATKLFNTISGITGKMIVDGNPVNAATTYQFSTTGVHIVKIKDDVTVGKRFYNCPALIKYIFASTSDGNKALGWCYFYNCTGLKKIHLPSYITGHNTSGQCFFGCSSLEEFSSDNFSVISGNVFEQANSIKFAKLNGNVRFGNTSRIRVFPQTAPLKTIIFGPNTSYIGDQSFYGTTATPDIIVQCTTPPETATNAFYGFNSRFRIWVPYSSDHSILDTYKSATGFSSKASQIFELTPFGTIR